MPDQKSPGKIGFEFSFQKSKSSEPVDEDAPLRLAILGNFGGHSGRFSDRAPRVDCDNFEASCAGFGASLSLPPCADGTSEIVLQFASLDDFHPDRLLKAVPALADLVALRKRAKDPASADSAAAEIERLLGSSAQTPVASARTMESPESSADLIARLMGKPATGAPAVPAPAPQSIVDRLIRQAVAPSSTSAQTPEQRSLVARLESEIAKRLRAILHHPDFQALESTWRGLDFLVRESGDEVHIHAIDCSREELERQLSGEGLAGSSLTRRLAELSPLVVLSGFIFGPSDCELLMRVSQLAAACGTAFVAGALPELAGCSSIAAQPNPLDWKTGPDLQRYAELRRTSEASRVALAMPRFLIRQPYGKGDPIETLPFEELEGANWHRGCLWTSSAFLCGRLILDAFAEDGWDADFSGLSGRVSGVPVHAMIVDGESQTVPCAEAWLSERGADAILACGLIPVLSVRGRDAVQVVSARSIAEPPCPLAIRGS